MKTRTRSGLYSFCMFIVLWIAGGGQSVFAQTFSHPGMLVSEDDISRIKGKISLGEEPWVGGLKALEDNWHSWPTYGVRGPVDTIYRGGSFPQNYMLLAHDASAAYANALRWKIHGTEDNAKKAVAILNAYANRLKAIGGSTDAMLAMGFQGYQLANAAEIMRTYEGWSAEELKLFQDFMINVFYGLPTNPHYNGIRRFLLAHNGTQDGYYWANWDIAAMTTLLAIGILCDNRDIYNEAIEYFKSGSGNGNIHKLVNYVYDGGLGQWQESGRDQGHTAMGPPLMAIFCEMAWKQGDDLYGYDDNRLLKGSEYVAKYNLGNAVPFSTYYHPKNFGGHEEQTVIASGGRGNIRYGWDLLYNHYVIRKGLHAPFTQITASIQRPEGGPNNGNSGDFDLIGYSTLTASVDRGTPKKEQLILWNDTSMTLRGPNMDPGAKTNSGNPCYYTLSDHSMAEIVNNKIHPLKAGSVYVTAWQPGDDEYAEAKSVTRKITIVDSGALAQPELDGATIMLVLVSTNMCAAVPGSSTVEGSNIIQWRCTSGSEQKWKLQRIQGQDYFIININSGKALNVVNNAVASGSSVEQRTIAEGLYQVWNIAMNSDGTYHIMNQGNQHFLGALDANTSEGSAFGVETSSDAPSQQFNISVEKKNQLISFGALPSAHPNDSGLVLSAKASSDLPIEYVSTNPAIATISNNILHVHKSGNVGIIATQAGNGEYNPAFDVTQWLKITKRAQTIHVSELMDLHAGDSNIKLGASASSGLPVEVTSSNVMVAQYESSTGSVILVGEGTSLFTIIQQGNEEYLPTSKEFDVIVGEARPSSIGTETLIHPLKASMENGQFIIALDAEQAIEPLVSVFDINGKKYSVDPIRSGNSYSVNLLQLPIGSYFLNLVYGDKYHSFKIEKK